MSTSRLEKFHQLWTDKWTLTAKWHWDEFVSYIREADEKKQSARERAQIQLEDLRNSDTLPASFDDEVRKIRENLDATLELIEKEHSELIRSIKETQLKEKADHEKAYQEALAARPFLSDFSPNPSAAAIVAAHSNTSVANVGDTASTSRTTASISPGPHFQCPVGLAQDAALATPAPKEQGTPALSEKNFSCTIKPLQDIIESRSDRSLPGAMPVKPSPTPIDASSTTDNGTGLPRTVTFDEVYQNGQAKHKDTIVEFPPASGKWYIFKCEEHKIRFGRRPFLGAGKHLNGRLHGGLEKSRSVAIEVLGYQVIDCTKELAALNNEVVNNAFANGYKPENTTNRNQYPEMATDAIKGGSGDGGPITDTISGLREGGQKTQIGIGSKSASVSRKKRRKARRDGQTGITNPKTFHIYNCFWKTDRCRYPVMILAWDDQKSGGLEHDLAGTGLLKKESNPPNCYVYKDTESGKHTAIAGWAPGFEDGGLRVSQRKFPAMFFDPEQGVSWVSANLLSKFPLYKPNPPKKRSHPFNLARLWIAKKEGFASWEEFEADRKGKAEGKPRRIISTPSVSPLSNIDDADSDSSTEGSSLSAASNGTEKELLEMLDRAGEITGDSDYAGSDADSSSETEHELWEQPQTDGRPWAWYGLRNKTSIEPSKTEPSTPTTVKKPEASKMILSVEEGMNTARHFPVQACAQDDGFSVNKDSTCENSVVGDPPEGTLQNPARDSGGESPKTTSVTDPSESVDVHGDLAVDAVNMVNRATPPLGGQISGQTMQISGDHAGGDFRTGLGTPTDLPSRPPTLDEVDVSKGRKRARSEEGAEMDNDTSVEQSVKKPKQNADGPGKGEDMSRHSRPGSTPSPSAAPSFKPKDPLGPAAFELSSYSKGPVSWDRASEDVSLTLYYGEGDRTVGTVNGAVDVVIDPTRLRGITREEIPESRGNVVMALLDKDPDEPPIKVVFDRPKGSKADIGKMQSRNLLRWIRSIVPSLPLLHG